MVACRDIDSRNMPISELLRCKNNKRKINVKSISSVNWILIYYLDNQIQK